MTTTQFHSEYEIVKWLASRDNFDRGLAELREALANDTIVNGRGLVQKWLSIYDDVTTGRIVESSSVPTTAPAPLRARQDEPTAPTQEDRLLLERTVQEARLWAEAAKEAAVRASARVDQLEEMALREPLHEESGSAGGRSGFALALIALVLSVLLVILLWPQLEARGLAVWRLLARQFAF